MNLREFQEALAKRGEVVSKMGVWKWIKKKKIKATNVKRSFNTNAAWDIPESELDVIKKKV